jgi:hypothetical protein
MMKWKPDSERPVGSWANARELITEPSENGMRLCPTEISCDTDYQITSLAETKLIQKLSEIFGLHLQYSFNSLH